MKKILVILLFLILAVLPLAWAQEVYVGNTHNLTWDQVTVPANAQSVSYELAVVEADGTEHITATETPPMTVDISAYPGQISVWVRTIVVLDDGSILQSEWVKAEIEGVPSPFVLRRDVPPPANFRRQ